MIKFSEQRSRGVLSSGARQKTSEMGLVGNMHVCVLARAVPAMVYRLQEVKPDTVSPPEFSREVRNLEFYVTSPEFCMLATKVN